MPQQVNDLAQHFLAGDQDTAWELIQSDFHKEKDTLYIFNSLITEAMRMIGKWWEIGKITVADEHLATTTCDFVITRYHFQVKKQQDKQEIQERPKAMFLCLEQEQHYLGLKMTALLFEENGWDVRLMGPSLPLEYAETTAKEWKPDLIGLSVTIMYHAERLEQYVETLESIEHKPTIMVGGRLTAAYDFSLYCSQETKILTSLEEVSAWLSEEGNRSKKNVSN
ncbi:cobalamin B12-binding domain-containing protein [Bacillus tianshenii]|nr:cobalamin B12-binding domain-containing protein [Bacillus tianshenii]